MKKSLAVSVVLGWLSFVITPALASFINLNTSLTSTVVTNDLSVLVSSVNRGDEPAHNVQAEIRVGDRSVLGSKSNAIPVKGTYSADFHVSLDLKAAGVYPLALILHYTDANQYPFSALTIQPFVFGKEDVSPVFGQAKAATFSRAGKFRLNLKNLSDREVRTATRLIVPRELTVTEDVKALTLEPKGETRASFAVRNFTALVGSSYQVYAVSEFDANGLHYTSIVPGTITIAESSAMFGTKRVTLIVILAVLVVLVVLFVGAQFKRT